MKAPLTLIYFVVRIILIYRISFEYIYFFSVSQLHAVAVLWLL